MIVTCKSPPPPPPPAKVLKAVLSSRHVPSRLQATIDGNSFNIRRYVHTERAAQAGSSKQANGNWHMGIWSYWRAKAKMAHHKLLGSNILTLF
jgi:hypothetical protein